MDKLLELNETAIYKKWTDIQNELTKLGIDYNIKYDPRQVYSSPCEELLTINGSEAAGLFLDTNDWTNCFIAIGEELNEAPRRATAKQIADMILNELGINVKEAVLESVSLEEASKKYPDFITGSGYSIRDGSPNSYSNSYQLTGRKLKNGTIKFNSTYNYSKSAGTPWVRCLNKADGDKLCASLKNQFPDLEPIKNGNQQVLELLGMIGDVPVYVCTGEHYETKKYLDKDTDKIVSKDAYDKKYGKAEEFKKLRKEMISKYWYHSYSYWTNQLVCPLDPPLSITNKELKDAAPELRFSVLNEQSTASSFLFCASLNISKTNLMKYFNINLNALAKDYEVVKAIKSRFESAVTNCSGCYLDFNNIHISLNFRLYFKDYINPILDGKSSMEDVPKKLSADIYDRLDWDNTQEQIVDLLHKINDYYFKDSALE